MSRLGSGFTEISTGRNNSLSEDMMPNAVHHDPCGERMVRLGHPFGEFHPTLRIGCSGIEPEIAVEHFESGRHDFVARILRTAAVENFRHRRFTIESTDETVTRPLLDEFPDQIVKTFRRLGQPWIALEQLPGPTRLSDFLPGPARLQHTDLHPRERATVIRV